MPTSIFRAAVEGAPALAVRSSEGGPPGRIDGRMCDLLRCSRDEFELRWRAAVAAEEDAGVLLAPLDGGTEVWAAGVTYERSQQARTEESEVPDVYARVYSADRPELFFKANPRRVAGDREPIAVRGDSGWNVPEPELALVVNCAGEIVACTVANDVSSRQIEGENPLYLPQAKVYAGCCGLGPGIVPLSEAPPLDDLAIRMRIDRAGAEAWSGECSTRALRRAPQELVEFLFREDEFPDGVVLCTGTGLVPDPPFTLLAGDVVSIEIDGVGTLRNPTVAGKRALSGGLAGRARG